MDDRGDDTPGSPALDRLLRQAFGRAALTDDEHRRQRRRLEDRIGRINPGGSVPADDHDVAPVAPGHVRPRGRRARPQLETTYVWRADERRGRAAAGLRALVAVVVLVLVGSVLAGVLSNHGSGNLPATGGATPASGAAAGSATTPATWTGSGQLTVPMVVSPGQGRAPVTGDVVAQIMPDRELRLSAAVTVPATIPLVWHVLPWSCAEAVTLLGTPSATADVVPPFVGAGGGTALVPANQTHQPLAVLPVDLTSGAPLGCATIPLVPPGLVVTYRPAAEVPASCPVTLPTDPPFSPPAPYTATPPYGGDFSYGTPALWTALPLGGVWQDLPFSGGGYAQKIYWWNPAYPADARQDPTRYAVPPLTVTGRRLDGNAPPLLADRATNVDLASMLVLVHFPTAGCWQVTGAYQGHSLSFVVWIGGVTTPSTTPAATSTPSAAGALARPLRLPGMAADGSCPVSAAHTVDGLTGLGPGPLYPVTFLAVPSIHKAFSHYVAADGWATYGSTWVSTAGGGPFLVRGRQLDGNHGVRFRPVGTAGGQSPTTELLLTANNRDQTTPDSLWRSAALQVSAPGCYALQVDSETTRYVVVFDVPASDAATPTARASTSATVPASCPMTRPSRPPFVPSSIVDPTPPFSSEFWYGDQALWTLLGNDGNWSSLPVAAGGTLTQKVFWWSPDDLKDLSPNPALMVTGHWLDGAAPPLQASIATNGGHAGMGTFMFVGVSVPTTGCWQISGTYRGRALSVVVWVGPGLPPRATA